MRNAPTDFSVGALHKAPRPMVTTMLHSTPNLKRIGNETDVVYELRERVRQLEAIVGLTHQPPRCIKLQAMQARLLGLLIRRPIVHSLEALFDAMYGDRADPPTSNTLQMQVSLLRRALAPHGVEIETHHRQGYSITPDNLAKLKALYAPGERQPEETP